MSLRRRFRLSKPVLALSASALLLTGTAAFAQVISDAQIPFNFSSPSLIGPAGVAVAPDGTVYLADIQSGTAANLVRIMPATGTVGGSSGAAASIAATGATLTPTGVTMKRPTAVAVDSTGVLYVADAGAGKVFKVVSPESSTTPAAVSVPYGGTAPTALAVDSANNLYIADETAGAIYEVVGGVAATLPIGSGYKPVGLTVDGSGGVYFADASTSQIYKYTSGSTSLFLSTSSSGNFRFSGTQFVLPVGMGVDPAGDVYIMDSEHGRLIEATSSSNTFQVPFDSISHPGSIALSSTGNIYLTDDSNNAVDEIYYNNNPVNFGSLAAGAASSEVTLNFYFVSDESSVAYYQSVQGDSANNEFSNPGATTRACGTTRFDTTVSAGSSCNFLMEAAYLAGTPGMRLGADGLSYASGTSTAYATVPSDGVDLAGSLALYPGTQTVLSSSQTLYEPQAVAVSGDGGWLFVADEGGQMQASGTYTYPHPAVWAYQVTNGGSGTQVGTPSNTANQVGGALANLTNPIGVALDATGNLYVADYSGYVRKIPPAGNWNTAGVNLALPAGMLNHPLSIAVNPSGNIYIGDSGPLGPEATASNPGYIVEIPADGGPVVKLSFTVNGTPVVYPEGLTTDIYGNLYIADGGDFQNVSNTGGVDAVTASNGVISQSSSISAVSFGSYGNNGNSYSLNEPGSLSFDAAGDLYVLDSYNQRALVIPITYSGTTPAPQSTSVSPLGYGASGISSLLVTPSSMVVWPGGQNITISDLGYSPSPSSGAPSSPIQILTLQAYDASVVVSTGSGNLAGINVGNQRITFNNPSISGSGSGHTFTVASGSGECGAGSSTINPGVVNACSVTIDYAGSGTHQGTITLNGNTASDNSALGNVITATATPEQPVAQISGSGLSNHSVTVTIENVGAIPLIITNIELSNASQAILNGTTCQFGAAGALSIDQSCTATVTFNGGLFFGQYTGDLTFTDNNGGIVGSTQTECVYDTFGIFGGINSGACGGGFAAAIAGPATGSGVSSLTVSNTGRTNLGAGYTAPATQAGASGQQPVSTVQTGNTPQASGSYLPLGFVAPDFTTNDSADNTGVNDSSAVSNDDSAGSGQSETKDGKKKSHGQENVDSNGGNANPSGSGNSGAQQ